MTKTISELEAIIKSQEESAIIFRAMIDELKASRDTLYSQLGVERKARFESEEATTALQTVIKLQAEAVTRGIAEKNRLMRELKNKSDLIRDALNALESLAPPNKAISRAINILTMAGPLNASSEVLGVCPQCKARIKIVPETCSQSPTPPKTLTDERAEYFDPHPMRYAALRNGWQTAADYPAISIAEASIQCSLDLHSPDYQTAFCIGFDQQRSGQPKP